MVAAVAEETGKSKADVKEILEALIAQVVKTVKAGDEIALIGFGTLNLPNVLLEPDVIRLPAKKSKFRLLAAEICSRENVQGRS